MKSPKPTKSGNPNVRYIDLDAVAQEDVVVRIAGKDHPLVPVSVDNFIANTRMIEKLGDLTGNAEATLDLTKDLLLQAFPSMTAEQIGKMSMTQMGKLVELAHGANGQKAATDTAAVEAAKANPPTAG